MREWLSYLSWKWAFALMLLAFFTSLMIDITLEYIPIRFDVAFLNIKQEEVKLPYYRWSFYIHVYTSLFALIAGFTQFSSFLRKRVPIIHRSMGWMYIVVVLMLSCPSGLIMSFHANGGPWSVLAFSLLSISWLFTTTVALRSALLSRWIDHEKWMIRSYALTLSAITLRAWKWLIVALFAPPPMTVYQWVAWMGWGINLLVVEIWIARQMSFKPQIEIS